jgi:6-phosphogluconolactonase (cycloisomerase 2 family)
VTVDPSGRFAYVANFNSNNVTTFSINQTTGALTEVGTEVAAGTAPSSVTVDPSGRFAYVANQDSDNVTTFSIDATTGALTEVGTEVAAGDGPISIVILGVFQ